MFYSQLARGRRIYICSSSTTRHCGDICRFCFHKEAPCAWPGGIFLTLVSSTTQDIFPGCPLGHQSSYPYPTDQARATSSHDGGGSDRVGGSKSLGARRARLRLVEGQPAAHRLDPRRRRLILAPWYCRPPRIPRRVVTDHLLVHFKPLLVHLKYLARS